MHSQQQPQSALTKLTASVPFAFNTKEEAHRQPRPDFVDSIVNLPINVNRRAESPPNQNSDDGANIFDQRYLDYSRETLG